MANLLGIDIGPTSVRGVLVKTQLRRVQLTHYFEVPFTESPPAPVAPAEASPFPPMLGSPTFAADPASPVLDPITGLPQAADAPSPAALGDLQAKAAAAHAEALAAHAAATPLARAVAELIRLAGGSNIDIIAPLAGDSVSLRRVELPKAAEKKLDELLPFEMESVLPFEVADTLLDHQLIDADPKQLRLLVSAAPKARIREELARLKDAGADPVELVPAPAALGGLAQFIPSLATDGPHLVVVLGRSSTDACVLRKGRAELARTLSIGSEALWTRTVSPTFGLGLHEESQGGSMNEAAVAHLGRELKQTLLAHRMQGGGEPETVSIAGDAVVPGLLEALSAQLGKSVMPLAMPEIAVPPNAPNAPPPLDPAARMMFATALGVVGHSLLRGKHLDFRKGEFVKKRDLSMFRDFGPILGIAATAVACAFFFSIWARWSVLDGRREMLEDELARVSAERLGEETRSPTRARSLLETGRRSADPMPAFTAFDALVAVSNAVPEEVTHDLSRLAIDLGDSRSGGHLEIQGTVSSVDDAERISRALSEVECFQDLELGPATTTADGRRNYRIEGDILCPGAAPAEEGRGRRRGRSSGSGSREGAESGGEG